jgi:hypothetical protein
MPDLAPYVPFPVDLLPKSIAEYVQEGARAIHCDTAYVALPLLAALAAAIGNSRCICLKHGAFRWQEPAVLWTANVGESGTAKTPAIKAALLFIERRERQAIREAERRQAEYANEMLRYEVELTAWKRSGCKQGEPEPQKPAQPVCRRFSVSDTTVEALADRLADNPRGLLAVNDELSGWFGSFGQYKAGKGADCAHYLSMYDASPLRIDRKTGERRTTYIPRAAVSICGGIQPDVLRVAFGREHFADGLAARFLLAMPPRRPARWSDAEIPHAVGERVADIFDRLWELEPDLDEDDQPRPRSLNLSPEAKTAWKDYFNRHGGEQVELDGDLAAAWSKLRGCAARLALIVHLAQWASGAEVDPDRIDQNSILAGIGLSDWFGQEAQRVYGILSESEEDREEREFLAWIKRRGGRATVREITRGLRRFRGDVVAVEKALARLVKKRLGRWVPVAHGGGPGRPASVFELLPSGDGDENTEFPGKTRIVSPSPEKNTGNGRRPRNDADTVNRLLAEAADEGAESL